LQTPALEELLQLQHLLLLEQLCHAQLEQICAQIKLQLAVVPVLSQEGCVSLVLLSTALSKLEFKLMDFQTIASKVQ
jgi:hypothetical protein